MDTITTIFKPPLHEHPLFPSARFVVDECNGCHVTETMYGGYYCNEFECVVWFHKQCAEAPLEINNLFHTQHPLMLTNDLGDGPCNLCGQKIFPPGYNCSTCEFKVDLACGMKPSPPAIEHPLCHDHSLVFVKKQEENNPCEVCKKYIGGPSYSCLECNVYFHVDCIHFSKEVNHPRHSCRPLKLISFEALTDDAEKICLSCEQPPEKVLYHCSLCNFSICLGCTKNPFPFVIEDTKTHKHPLSLFSRRISYTCDACGMNGNMKPYVCYQCDFVIHGKCISLPRVININRHQHRISFTHHLGPGYSNCGVCRQSLSRYYGAYSCSVCPKYAVHSRCGVKLYVWDYVELEGIPDDTEDIAPFKVLGDDLIKHFSHEKHPLKLSKECIHPNEWLRCEACIYPLGYKPIYACEKCCFFLHEKCASLVKKKRLVFDTAIYMLEAVSGYVICKLCKTLSDGFKYISQDGRQNDIHCGSISEPFVHDGHLHPLYFDEKQGHICNGCSNKIYSHVLRCDFCDFDLCFYCASLPDKIWHMNDEHPLILCCDERERGENWCDNCEEEMYPNKWFYTCFDCRVAWHPRCVLGDFSRLKLEDLIGYEEKDFEVIVNNHNTRPLCTWCHFRCKISVILKDWDEDNGYICSLSCLMSYLGRSLELK